MRKNHLLTANLLSMLLVFTACEKKEQEVHPDKIGENQFVRLLVADETNSNVYLLEPAAQKIETFTAQFPGSSLYPTASGRYAALINYTHNYVQFFDSGIEAHGDHVHVKGTPKWAKTTATAPKPTHFYASGNQIAIFNDGDGSLSLTAEDRLHEDDKAVHIIVDKPHHGAVVLFENGNMAVTEKDNSVAGSLPERVKIVDPTGKVLHSSTLATGGIHGDAGDGKWALFGSSSGVLKVYEDGTQGLIKYPDHFGKNWLSTVYYGAESKKFIGFRAKLGVYFVSPQHDVITPVLEDAGIVSARFDAQGRDVLVLKNDGTVLVFDGLSGTKKTERGLALTFPTEGKSGGPALTASGKYVYVTNPEKGEVFMLSRHNLANYHTFSIPGKPGKLTLIGADMDEETGH